MLENICGLTLKGKYFTDEVTLPLFDQTNSRIALIFGRNGSGKSTIADAFCAYRDVDFSELSVGLFDYTSKPQDIPADRRKKLFFVFNEKYIDANVKFADDGLNTIILLGDQTSLDAEIKEKEKALLFIQTGVEAAKEKAEQYADPQNPISPVYHLNGIKKRLREDGGWAEIEGEFKEKKQKAKVSDDVVEEIKKAKSEKSIQELREDFNRIKDLQKKVASLPDEYNNQVNPIVGFEKIDEQVRFLAEKRIEQIALTDREKEIMRVVQQGLQSQVEASRILFSKEDATYCPHCFQPLTATYKEELVTSINRVLNKEANEHKAELLSFSFPQIVFDYEKYRALDEDTSLKIKEQIAVCTHLIEKYSQILKAKSENVFLPIIFESENLEDQFIKLNNLLQALEHARLAFVLASKQSKDNLLKLSLINKQITCKVLEGEYAEYARLQKAKSVADDDYNKKVYTQKEVERQLSALKQRKENVFVATTEINHALQYIFFSKDRLSIEYRDNLYYLKVNGRYVRPKDASSGERNIIAFCYFFTQIMSNENVKDLYKNEMFLIIDDPISSFDFENKIGILSYINAQVRKIVFGNKHSKIVLLTHDLVSMFDLQKGINSICESTKGNQELKTNCSYLELQKKELVRFSDKRHEYTELIEAVYEYALNGNIESSMYIGNYMRRVVEAFATFNYKQGIDFIFKEKRLQPYITDKYDYFENLMYRLVLHNESHSKERVKELNDNNSFFNYISDEEKQRTAQDILCLLYCLNPIHVKAHLDAIKDASENIERWIENIPPDNTDEHTNLRTIPLFVFPLSAGSGNAIDEGFQPSDTLRVEDTECDKAFRIAGDSMMPQYSDGQIVLVKSIEIVPDGKVGVFFYDGAVYIKQKIIENGKTILHSFNPKYEDIVLKEEMTYKEYGLVVATYN